MPVRVPRKPPVLSYLAGGTVSGDDPDLQRAARASIRHRSPLLDGKYLHWDDVRHRDPPASLEGDREAWWWAAKFARLGGRREVPVTGTDGRAFSYVAVDPIPEVLHFLDQQAGGSIQFPAQGLTEAHRDRFHVNSLVEEAVRSSQIEGASTTREEARDLVRSGRRPRDRSEQMVLNNYETMRRIVELRDQPLTPAIVLELQRRITENTLKIPDAAGRLRRPEEDWVVVEDDEGNDLHVPPPAGRLARRLETLCDFANGRPSDGFVHPVVRAVTLHFWLAYDHPFLDGNGRTARALFYWCMLRHGYWLFEFVSISSVINRAKKQYGRAFLLTETDDNDLTYFLLYHLRVVRQAVEDVRTYVARKLDEMRQAESALGGPFAALNHRQKALVQHAVRHPGFEYTFESHRRSHGVVRQTARTDLLALAEAGLLERAKRGRLLVFRSPPDLADRLRRPAAG